MSVDSSVFHWVPLLHARDRGHSWEDFLDEYAPVVLQVVRLFARDEDQVHDCFVFVCERIKANNLARLRRFEPAGRASFPTWLRAVVRNLCLDWHRKRYGRPRLYRSIARLPELEREIFRLVHMNRLTESEAFHTAKSLFPSLTWSQFKEGTVHVQSSLSSRQSWLLTISNPRLQSLSSAARNPLGDEPDREIRDITHDPEEKTSRREYLESLKQSLSHLSKHERLIVRLRFEQELSLEQIARLVGMNGRREVQAVLQTALELMRDEIASNIHQPVSVKD